MGTSKAGRWIVAAVLVAGAVAAFLLLMRADVGPAEATASDARPGAATAASGVPAKENASAAPKHDAPRRVAVSAATSATGDARRGTVVLHVIAAENDAPIAGAAVSVGTLDGRTDAAGNARFQDLDACDWSFEAKAPGRLKRSFRRAVPGSAETTIEVRLVASALLAVRLEDRATGAPVDGGSVTVAVVGCKAKDAGAALGGEFVVAEPAGSILRVTATSYDYHGYEQAVASVRLGGPGTTTPLVLRLVQPGRMTGVVRAPDGTVVAGARIRVAAAPFSRPEVEWQWSPSASNPNELLAVSDTDGRFVLTSLVHGRRYVAVATDANGAWAPSETATGLVAPADGTDVTQDFTLREFGTVVLRITDVNGAPVTDAAVMVAEGSGIGSYPRSQREAGVHRLVPRAPGALGLLIWSQRGSSMRRVVVPAGGTVEVDVVLGAADTVKCLVVDDLGRPVAGAKIDAQSSISHVAFETKLTTDAAGTASLPRLDGCVRRLTVTAPEMLPTTVESDAGSADDVRVVMQRAAVLTFRVLGVDGAPCVENYRVLLGDDSREFSGASLADGRVRIDCEPRGEIHVRLIFDSGAPLVLRATLAAGAVADLDDVRLVAPRHLSGRVVDAAGRPVEGAFVGVDSGKDGGTPSSGRAFSGVSDVLSLSESDGTFSVDFAPPSGPLPFEATADGFVDLHTVVTVHGDDSITLTLQRGGLVWGEVVDATGAPLDRVTVRVIDARGAEVAAPKTGPHGEFDVRVAPGRYTVRAERCDDISVELREDTDAHVALTGRSR